MRNACSRQGIEGCFVASLTRRDLKKRCLRSRARAVPPGTARLDRRARKETSSARKTSLSAAFAVASRTAPGIFLDADHMRSAFRKKERECPGAAIEIDETLLRLHERRKIVENAPDHLTVDLKERGDGNTESVRRSMRSVISGRPASISRRRPSTAFSLAGSEAFESPTTPGSRADERRRERREERIDGFVVVTATTISPESRPARATTCRASASAAPQFGLRRNRTQCGNRAHRVPAKRRGTPSISTSSCGPAA